ncbi:MAG TPA: toll/interleukin-1 receptor domain-containing protein [Nitrososphaera sp.]|nr:toll/interleukin-1 receptor domain-containing protein [Nitrososphaera sp.]
MPTSSPTATSTTKDQHVFLSYSSHDRDLALELKHALEACGVNVWIDVDRIRPGSLFITELEQAIEKASAFVVLVTAASLSSGWVREECGRAINLSIQSMFRLPVIPIAVEGVVIPGFLANRQALQLPSRGHLVSVAALIAAELSTSLVASQKQERRTKIRWHSRCANFSNGDISVLAILETVVAVATIIALSMYSGSLRYIIALTFIAPFALLQTDQSRSVGIRLLRRLQWWNRIKPDSENGSRIAKTIRIVTLALTFMSWLFVPSVSQPPLQLAIFVLFGVLFYLTLLAMTPPLIVRSTAILFTVIRHPITTLRAVPTNWKNLNLSKDLLEEPEVIPGYLDAVSTGELCSDLRIPNFLRGIARPPIPEVFCDAGAGLFLQVSMTGLVLLTAILLYVPYYSTRWALKSTAAIWAPLLWIASATNGSTLPLYLRLRVLVEDATNRVVYAFSWLALTFLIAIRLGLFPASTGAFSSFNRINIFLQQPLPELCIASAALIAIGLRLFASRVLLLYFHKKMSLTAINKAINLATFIQRLIVLLLLVMVIAELLKQ